MESKHEHAFIEPSRMTLADYLRDEWLPAMRGEVRPSTLDSYRRNIELHVVPRLGRTALQKLTPADLTRHYAHLLAEGRRDGEGGLSLKTVRNIHQVLRKAFEDAARLGYLARNPTASANAPKPSAAIGREMVVWNADELRRFLAQQQDHRLYALFFLAAHTGMRRGEVLGLRWRDVDLANARVAVRRSIISVAYKVQISDAKTERSRRVIDLDARTVETLRAHRAVQAIERKEIGACHAGSDLVFCRPDGTPLHPDIFRQTFRRRVARAGVPKIRFHDLRHTHASLLMQAGVPAKVVSERLGHATVGFTMQIYAHVMPGMQADAAAAFSDLIYGAQPTDEDRNDDANDRDLD